MSIINGTYFKNDIYLPHFTPSVTNAVKDVESKGKDFIDQYEQDCLVKSFGSRLSLEFFGNLDDTEPSLIKSGADAKWGDLLNGKSYTRPNGDNVVWKGIRQKTMSLGTDTQVDNYDKSFLADYVYFFYESNSHITRSNAGNQKAKAANAERVEPTHKVVKAWRKFLREVQGETQTSPYSLKTGLFTGIVADYWIGGDGAEISLYQFISDQNELVEDTYANFEPKVWGRVTKII